MALSLLNTGKVQMGEEDGREMDGRSVMKLFSYSLNALGAYLEFMV
jgi:hypothetical protein